jgi:PAS domain S-box-containing protein
MPNSATGNLYEHITGYWQWSIDDRDSYVNPVLKAALGYNDDEFADKISEWKKLVFPEDMAKLVDVVQKHIQSKGAIPLTQEIRFHHKNGSTVFILFSGRVMQYTAEGKAQAIFGSHINITAQKQTEIELKRTRDFLKRTSEAGMIGGWELDVLTQKVTWTDVTRRIFGVDDDYEPEHGSASSFFKEGEDRDKLLKAAQIAIQLGKPYDLELRVISATGETKWTRTVGQPEFEDDRCVRLYGIFQDITARKKQEEAIKQKQLQLETFIKHSPVQLAMMDKELRYMAVSELWMASYNLDISTLAGRSHFEVFPEIPDVWRVYLARCLRGEVIRKEEDMFYRMDGRQEWLRWEIRPWYESDGVVGGIIMYTELVTEKKRIQEALIKAKEAAEEAAATKARFLSVMSHEIRTPMNGVIGFTNLLLKNPREDQREALNVLKFSAQNLMVIINDVLDLNKIDAGKVKFEHISFDLNGLLQNICHSHDQDANEKNLKLNVQFDPDLQHWFYGDPVRIGQVINNLVSNAIKFTPAGKINISTALVANHDKTMHIGFAVSDTGIGIPEDKQEYIFEMFNQAEDETTRMYGGTGLGLTITKRLLQLMGSDIQLRSTPGEGSIFYFDLELEKSAAPVADGGKKAMFNKLNTLQGLKILITDDNPVNVLVVKRFLQQWQAEYDIAENGQIALDKVKASDYDLVLMDLKMPVMDGYEATKAIRKLDGEKYKYLPIIALTASALADTRDEMVESGMNDYVCKPFNPDELFERIKQYTQPHSV